jgi:folylpolyglutamate synthase/dihydropteroate synthase
MSPILLAAKSRHPRAAPSDTIAETAQRLGLRVDFRSDDVGEATRRARQIAASGDLVLGTGSLSVAAEVIEEIRGVEPELYPYMEPPRASA